MDKDFIEALVRPMGPVIQNSFFGYALAQAIVDDYAETIAKLTGEDAELIKQRIIKNANLKFEKLKDNTGWQLKD